MAYTITPITEEDFQPVMEIFNHYVENSFAAYPERKIPYPAVELMLKASGNHPTGGIRDSEGSLVGFGMLRPYHPMPAFSRVAEITSFLHPSHTGKGLGKMLLAFLEAEGRKRGVATILASISSRNPGSIRFHTRNGFVECGRFMSVGKKHNTLFDVVWMQKMVTFYPVAF